MSLNLVQMLNWMLDTQAGEKVLSCGDLNMSKIDELTSIKELHLR